MKSTVMPSLSSYVDEILKLHRCGKSQREIANILCARQIRCSRTGIYWVLRENREVQNKTPENSKVV